MEITDRDDIGGALRAPQVGNKGQSVGHYDIVKLIRPGDVVFHWDTDAPGGSAIVGWSEAVGPLRVADFEWSAHAGSMAGAENGLQPNWVMPLGGLHLLDRPITATNLRAHRDDVFAIRADLKAARRGSVHFPFVTHGSDVRSFQGYMTKMPRALVDLLGEIGNLELDPLSTAGDVELDEAIEIAEDAGGAVGYQSDARRRRAIEVHAVERAIVLYTDLGATEILVLGKPYDLLVQLNGEERHVEVKGSSGTAGAVLVTRNEVHHARVHSPTDLVVVDQIIVSTSEDGSIATAAGRLRRWVNWEPLDEQLIATAFECQLPIIEEQS